MTKELTPLEVSNQLKDFVLEFVKNGLDRSFIRGSFDIIETTLKEWQLWKDNLECGDFEDKRTKALEIIKEKGIVVQFIKETNSVEQYNAVINGYLLKPYTQEEYDLLKEVLCE